MYGVVVHNHADQLRHDDQRGAHRRQQIRQLRVTHADGHPSQRVLLAGAIQVQKEDTASRVLPRWRRVLYLAAVCTKGLVKTYRWLNSHE